MLTPLVLFTWLIVVSTSIGAAPSDSAIQELGKVIDLRLTNLLDDFQERERTIFEPFDPKCFIDETKQVKSSRKFTEYYENSNAFYSSLITQSQLDVSLQSSYTLGVSLNAATRSKRSQTDKLSGMSLNAVAITEKILVKRGCLEGDGAKLKKTFVKDLKHLPVTIKYPWKTNSWEKYRTFLKNTVLMS